jgi:uncharacterized repeat protein (TIGR03809 family)
VKFERATMTPAKSGGGATMHDSISKSWQPKALARKWHALAERRRNHLKELYETGAWKRCFTEETLRAQMREAVREVEHWGAMLGDDGAGKAGREEASDTKPRAA